MPVELRDYGEGMALDNERGAHDRRIGGVNGLPDTMADDCDWWRSGLVIFESKNAAAESGYAKRRKISAGDIFGAQRPGSGLDTLAAHAEAAAASLESGDLSNSLVSAFSRSYKGNENIPHWSCGPPFTQQLSPSPTR